MEYHLTDDESVTFKSVRADSKGEAITNALDQLPDVGPDWQKASVIHQESDIYVVRATAPKVVA